VVYVPKNVSTSTLDPPSFLKTQLSLYSVQLALTGCSSEFKVQLWPCVMHKDQLSHFPSAVPTCSPPPPASFPILPAPLPSPIPLLHPPIPPCPLPSPIPQSEKLLHILVANCKVLAMYHKNPMSKIPSLLYMWGYYIE